MFHPIHRIADVTRRMTVPTVAVLLSTLPVLIIGPVSYFYTHRSLSHLILEENVERAHTVADKLNRFMRERVADVEVISTLPLLTDGRMRQVLGRAEGDSVLARFRNAYAVYDSVAVFDISGKPIMRSGHGAVGKLDRGYLREVLRAEGPVTS